MKRKIDVLSEVKQRAVEAKDRKEFLDSLDAQNLLFTTQIYAIMGKFQCDAKEAGVIIGKHMKGEY